METTAELLNLDTTGEEPRASDLTELDGFTPMPNRCPNGRTFPPDDFDEREPVAFVLLGIGA